MKLNYPQLLYLILSILNILIFRKNKIVNNDITLSILLLLISVYIVFNFEKMKESKLLVKYKCIKGQVLLLCGALYLSFTLSGLAIFSDFGIVNIGLFEIISYIIVFLWSIPVVICTIYLYEMLSHKNLINSKKQTPIESSKVFKISFLITFIAGILYLCAYNPANMFADSVWQYRQIKNIDIYPYNDWHPVFHTLLMKFILHFINTPAAIVLIQISVMSLLIALFSKEVYELGVAKKIIYLVNIFISCNIAYGTMITNIWKDTPFTIAIFALTFFVYLFIKNNCEYNMKQYVLLSITLTGVYLFRHNGNIPFIMSVLFFILYSIKYNKNKIIHILISIGISISCIFIVKSYLYNALNVIPVRTGTMAIPPLHGIASVIKGQDFDVLSNETKDLMESILPEKEWENRYNAFHSDDLLLGFRDMTYYDNTDDISIINVLSCYMDTLMKKPVQVIFDRLCGSELLWNITLENGSYNYVVEDNNSIEFNSELNIYRSNNIFTTLAKIIYRITEKVLILNILILRTGIFLYMLIILIIYSIINKIKNIFISIPCFSNVIAMLISMSCQHLRYVWFVNLTSIFILLIVISSNSNIKKKEDDLING